MIPKVIKVADLWRGKIVDSPQVARVFWSKGISPSILSDQGGEDDKFGTSKFHANPYFSCVTAIQMSNRRQWIVEITPDNSCDCQRPQSKL